ncbi:MAG: Bug family tripartite tricarboxylate transporter substrate binding protein [Xanthobacteraceae bacterium]
MRSKSSGRLLSFAVLFATASAFPAFGQSVADFYKGKTVTLIVSSAPGGGYDTLARAIAPHLSRHIPGKPTVVVRNMAGAGGILAVNHLFNVAAKDGTVIGGVQNNTPFEPLFGTKEAKYDATRFNWLGTPSIETAMLTIWHKTPVNSWKDVLTREITVGSSGVNSTPSFYGRLLIETLKLKLKIVVGYRSQTEVLLAMERGEVDGYPSVFYSALTSTRATWLPKKLVKILVQIGLEKEPALGDVPSVLDLATGADDKALVAAGAGPLGAGRPYLMPPGVPADRVAAMQKAMMDTFKDPVFIAEAKKRRLDVKSPRSGQELHALLTRIYTQTPAPVVGRLRKIMNPG